jgi:hypothetical protein
LTFLTIADDILYFEDAPENRAMLLFRSHDAEIGRVYG